MIDSNVIQDQDYINNLPEETFLDPQVFEMVIIIILLFLILIVMLNLATRKRG